MNIEEKVKSILSEQLGIKPEAITSDADLVDDLGADSLDSVELVMAIENEFDLEISDEDAEKMKSVNDVMEYLKKRIEGNS